MEKEDENKNQKTTRKRIEMMKEKMTECWLLDADINFNLFVSFWQNDENVLLESENYGKL